MKQASKEEGWVHFLEVCSNVDSAEQLGHLFDLFFTFEEKETMKSRFLIIKALIENKLTQREIAETYHVSIAQITRGSNALKIIEPKLRKFLEKNI